MRPALLAQHADLAAFLWHRREAAVRAPHHDMRTLGDLDERVEANVDGLRVGGDAGWAACEAALDEEDPGTFFVASVIAMGLPAWRAIEDLVTNAAASLPLARAVVAGLAWAPLAEVEPFLPALLGHDSPSIRRMGIAACAAHRKDPDYPLAQALSDADCPLRARSLRAVGELGRADLWDAIEPDLAAPDDGVRFWSAASAALFGLPAALPVLRAFASAEGPLAEPAARLYVRCLSPEDARIWIEGLGPTRTAAVATGALGDPALVPALLGWMEEPALARVAAESFTTATGIEIAKELEAPPPEGWSVDELAEKNVLRDEDGALPWPKLDALRERWARVGGAQRPGLRHLLGVPVTPAQLGAVLRGGKQRQRAGAALEISLRSRGTPLFEVRARGPRQKLLLGRAA